MMKVLCTGSEGLIGKPLCAMLKERGDTVVRYDKAWGADILDWDKLFRTVRQHDPDAVIHLAAISGVEHSRSEPYLAWQINTMGTINVLEACKRRGVPVVTASSNHVYGHGDSPVAEDAPMLQLDTYSATKHAADVAARSYGHNYGLPVAVVRNTNCFGPEDPHLDHIVPSTIMSLLKGEAPVIKSDGKTVKSYLYVDDVASAYIAALDWLLHQQDGAGGAFNVTTERISVLDLVRKICTLIDSDIEPVVLGEPNDQSDEWLDDSRFRELTGWQPKHTLDEALEKTIKGFRGRYAASAS